MSEHIRRVVAVINQRHNWNWKLDRRCSGGLQGGAWQLSEPGGGKAILKWSTRPRFFTERRSAAMAKILAAGYPTPAWLAVGRTADSGYLLEEFIPGEPIEFTASAARQLVDVIELQAGLAPDLDQNWSTYVAADTDAAEYVSALDADLVRKFQRLRTDVEMPGSDMVHGDFNSCNVLAENGRITGVIDIEAFGRGTRAIDYA
jgi:aminoglycoside phosphotransferase